MSIFAEEKCPNICSENPDALGSTLPCSNCAPAIPSDGLLHGACPVSNADTISKCESSTDACPMPGNLGLHSKSYGDDGDGACDWCGARPPADYDKYDVEGYELAVNTKDGINVDETWDVLRRGVTTLHDARMLLNGASVTSDIAIINGGYTVVDDDGIPVAHFEDIDDARLFLSIRALVDLAATETSRANLAESQVRGLEGTLKAIREYDKTCGDRDPVDGERDALAGFESEQTHEANQPHRSISVRSLTEGVDDEFYVSAREARSLAAQLLQAADDHDAYVTMQRKHNVGPGTEFPNLAATPIVAVAPDGTTQDGVSISRGDVAL